MVLVRMVKPVRKKPMKIKKKMKKELVSLKIEKKPLTPEERKEKIRNDLLRIAKRYEDMKLYDDAIKYYKRLGKKDDIDRLKNIKREKYLEKAKEFEAEKKYKDALRLYENLKMTEDVGRINRTLGIDKSAEKDTRPAPPPEASETLEAPELELSSESEEGVSSDEIEEVRAELGDVKPQEVEEIPKYHGETETPEDSGVPGVPGMSGDSNKSFQICPYCGEELNLPKKPRFCPYCREAFV